MKRNILAILFVLVSVSACVTAPPPKPLPQPIAKKLENINVALVLGGGGSKGIAHIGAVEVLEENNTPIDLIVGSSAGSAIGAFYADGQSSKEINKKLSSLSIWDVLDPSIVDSMQVLVATKGFVKGNSYKEFLTKNISVKNIEDLKIPLVAVTTDINNSELYLIRTGSIAEAVNASSAIPPVFSPVELDGRVLVDGGVMEPVPVRVAMRYNPKMIISVDISSPPPKTKIHNMPQLLYQANWIYYYELARMQSLLADIDIHPDLDGHGIFEDHRKSDLYQAGRKAAIAQLPKIKARMMELGITSSM